MPTPFKLHRDRKHDHYWIEDEELYESYQTLRGLRWRHLASVPLFADSERCDEDCIRKVEEFLGMLSQNAKLLRQIERYNPEYS